MSWENDKERIAQYLTIRLYRENFLETIFNARDPKNKENGWRLKKKEYAHLRGLSKEEDLGDFSPVFLNLRPLGKNPRLFTEIGDAMVKLVTNEMPEVNNILGIEMAGIPVAVATSVINVLRYDRDLRFCYSRGLPEKARDPQDADRMLSTYGDKDLVEGEIREGDRFALWDDMITNSGSKQIADRILHFEAGRRNVKRINSDYVGVVLDREQGGEEELKQIGKSLHYMIPLKSKGLYWLMDAMSLDEFALIKDYQENEEKYQTPEAMEWVLKNRRAI